MFYTSETDRSSLMDAILGAERNCWNVVSLDIWIPWFLVTIQEFSVEDGSFASTLFVHNEHQVANLIAMGNILVVRIQKVQPSKDKHRGWHLEEILAVRATSACTTIDAPDSCITEEDAAEDISDLTQSQTRDDNSSIIWRRPITE